MNQPPPSTSFLRAPDGHYWINCNGCGRESEDCGTDRQKLSTAARTKGYKLVPGIGWICRDCSWAVLFEVNISGAIETNPS